MIAYGVVKSNRQKGYLYNSIVWRILYESSLGDLKYGLTKDIKRDVTQ